MQFGPPLVPATLVRRYKRFLFDAVLEGGPQAGRAITGSCPNTGSMLGLTAPGARIWLTEHDTPKRKYRHALELVEADGTLVGINTGRPNRLVEEAIGAGLIDDLGNYASLAREQRYGAASRVDILLDDPRRGRAYVEVKNVHLMRERGLAEFPDSVTARGAKHLDELANEVEAGRRAVMVYLVQYPGSERLSLARDIDPAYGAAFDRATERGVEALAYVCRVTQDEIAVATRIPIVG